MADTPAPHFKSQLSASVPDIINRSSSDTAIGEIRDSRPLMTRAKDGWRDKNPLSVSYTRNAALESEWSLIYIWLDVADS
jgi:hypothetical protein